MPNEQRVPGHRKGAEDMTIKEISEKYHITADTLRPRVRRFVSQ